jgi:hypothetical protein
MTSLDDGNWDDGLEGYDAYLEFEDEEEHLPTPREIPTQGSSWHVTHAILCTSILVHEEIIVLQWLDPP